MIKHSVGNPSPSASYFFESGPVGDALKIITGGNFLPSAEQHSITVILDLLALLARIRTVLAPFLVMEYL